jgi:hypothetical protein
MDKGCASWGCANATAMAFEKWCPQTFFHQSNAFAGRCQCHTRPRRTMGDICRLDHKQEQPQIDQIKAHGSFHEELAPSALPLGSVALRGRHQITWPSRHTTYVLVQQMPATGQEVQFPPPRAPRFARSADCARSARPSEFGEIDAGPAGHQNQCAMPQVRVLQMCLQGSEDWLYCAYPFDV